MAVNEQRDGVFLVFEYCEHDLANLLEHVPKAFSESEVKTLSVQLLAALGHLHRHWIIHRDVKMSNLLYNNRGELKLADFGLARTFRRERSYGLHVFANLEILLLKHHDYILQGPGGILLSGWLR